MFIIQETMALQVASIMENQFYKGQLIRKKNPDKLLLIVNWFILFSLIDSDLPIVDLDWLSHAYWIGHRLLCYCLAQILQ